MIKLGIIAGGAAEWSFESDPQCLLIVRSVSLFLYSRTSETSIKV